VLGVVQAARRLGAGVVLGRPEFDLARMRVGLDGRWISASAICMCVNAWTRDVLPGMPITPVRGQVLSYAPSAPVFGAGFGVGVTETGEYWQQLPGGEIVIGGCRTFAPGHDVDVHGFDVDARVQAGIEGVLPRLFPDLRDLNVQRRWSGTMGFTPDHNPIFDKHPDCALYYTGGFSGHGMPFAMTFGAWLAESVQLGSAIEPSRIYARSRFV
jgi:glycine/D-amino acid oxidase-like deaminating enzyme